VNNDYRLKRIEQPVTLFRLPASTRALPSITFVYEIVVGLKVMGGARGAEVAAPVSLPLLVPGEMHNANDAKTFLKHFSDCLFYFCSTYVRTASGHLCLRPYPSFSKLLI